MAGQGLLRFAYLADRVEIEDEPETRLTIKTTEDRLSALHDAIRAAHPYDTPQLLVQTVHVHSLAVSDPVRSTAARRTT